MKILITGGAGFIGSNFIYYLLKTYPDQIINLDFLTYAANLKTLQQAEKDSRYTFIHGDICNSKLVEGICADEGIDFIVNFAAESHVDRSIVEPADFIKTNIMGTQVLLAAALKYQVKKYLQISTDEVYGSLGWKGFFTEDSPLAPNSPYSASKASADLLVRAYHKTYGLPVSITRSSNNYGPYQHPEKLIPLLINNSIHNQALPLYGDGQNIRDWIHVQDHCRAIDLVLRKGADGRVYNIGGGNEKTNLKIAEKILAFLKKPDSLIKFVKDRPGHDQRYAVNYDRIRDELGWEPEIDFQFGLEETICWYLENQNWTNNKNNHYY